MAGPESLAPIEQRRKSVVSYKDYLVKIAKLTKEATIPGGGPGGYPADVKSAAQRALYNNLGKNEGVALAVDAAIMGSLQNGWKTNAMKTKRVRNAIHATLKKTAALPLPVKATHEDMKVLEALTNKILELAKHQNEY